MHTSPRQFKKDSLSEKKNNNAPSIQFKDNRALNSYHTDLQKSISQSPKSVAQRAQINTVTAPIQKVANKTGLPDQLKSGIENLSGLDMSDTRVHYNSSKPAQLQAHAYAQGNHVHIAPGQEKHLPHEAWHVVQQKQGRVRPTMQMKGKVNINDDQGLEREADVMGAKAMQMKFASIPSQSPKQIVNYSNAVQRVEFEYRKEKFDSTDTIEFRKWATNNPGKLEGIAEFIANKEEIPLLEKKYLLSIINDQSENNLPEEEQKALPIRSTIYGMDKAKGQNGKENIALAYANGFRDFDAAVHYQKGKTAELFNDLKIDNGIIRITYKYKPKEQRTAYHDLVNLKKINGVYIHTIMLHEVPSNKKEIKKSFTDLQRMGKMFNAKIGLSNVQQLDDVKLDDNLENLLEIAKKKDMVISSIQNRVSPAAPDKRVRQIAESNGIDYMGFGLSGAADTGGTCEINETSAVENYAIYMDPIFQKKIKEIGLNADQTKRTFLDWGRARKIKVISSSTSSKGMHHMREPFASDFLRFLDDFGHGNEFYANTANSDNYKSAPVFLPFQEYLKTQNVEKEFSFIKGLVPITMWRLYYKHLIVAKNQHDLVSALKRAGTKHSDDIFGLSIQLFPKGIKSVTDLDNVLEAYSTSGYTPKVERKLPRTVSKLQLLSMGFDMGFQNAFIQDDQSDVLLDPNNELDKIEKNHSIDIIAPIKQDSGQLQYVRQASFVKTGKDTFELVENE